MKEYWANNLTPCFCNVKISTTKADKGNRKASVPAVKFAVEIIFIMLATKTGLSIGLAIVLWLAC